MNTSPQPLCAVSYLIRPEDKTKLVVSETDVRLLEKNRAAAAAADAFTAAGLITAVGGRSVLTTKLAIQL